jgi:hypothetical protein
MAEDDAARVAYLSRWRLRAILMGLAAIGVLLNGLAFQVPWNWLEQIVREFGSALIVAAVIGGTVDIFFKKEFARDAFVAAFRYVLPTELKEEVLRVISYKFLCTESRMIVQIEPISGTELVRPHLGV